ncbi:hypothetical protein [Owenweeksia hongkongensis]|uniref:hypothetical protein n=1 Tax=Owenweeksia hongkongensis TaxID=253245 RepID=UPI003A92222B
MPQTNLDLEHLGRIAECLEAYDSVFFYTADPGASSALLPFHQVAKNSGKFRSWYVEGWAKYAYLPDACPFSAQGSWAQSKEKVAVFMGQQVDFDRAYQRIKLYKSLGADVHFISDHWKDISQSFRPTPDQAYVLPDYLYVPDSAAYDKQVEWLEAHGIPRDIVQSTVVDFFHPGIERSLKLISDVSSEMRLELLSKYSANRHVITMMLDCTTKHDRKVLGFNWETALTAAMDFFIEQYDDATLLVKPHPRQSKEEVLEFLSTRACPRVHMVEEDNPERFVAISDEIWGITTVLLVVALKAGRKIKVFMPERTPAGAAESNVHIEPYIVAK